MSALVGIQKVQNIDDNEEIKNKFNTLLNNFQSKIKLSSRNPNNVMIKVNMCFIKGPETGITVDPILVKWLCEWLLENFKIKMIYIAESDATHLNADMAFKTLGWTNEFSNMENITIFNLSSDKRRDIKFEGLYFHNRQISEKMLEVDLLISFAKLKTHLKQGITCVMKNQFGALPEKLKIKYHPFLAEAIVDSVSMRPPDLCIVDGIIGHQGPGPVGGMPKVAGLLIAGTDAVATDHACAKLMGINPLRVPHIRLAIKNNIGTTNYKVTGVSISDAKEKFLTIPLWKKIIEFLKQTINKIKD